MKFYNFLNEKEITEEDRKLFIEKIKKDCSYYLNDVKKLGYFLYSGRDFINEVGLLKVDKNREPLDTPKKVHDGLNLWFKKMFNCKIRSECVFATTNSSTANIFGNPFFIFPKGKYNVYISKEILDLTDQLPEQLRLPFDKIAADSFYEYIKLMLKRPDIIKKKSLINHTDLGLDKEKFYEEFPFLRKSRSNDIWIPHAQITNVLYSYEKLNKVSDFKVSGNKIRNEILIECDYYYIWREENSWDSGISYKDLMKIFFDK